MVEPQTAPMMCERCGATATVRQGRGWCEQCQVWLVLDPQTSQWISFAERERRVRVADYSAAVDASARAVADALPRLAELVPDGWSISAGPDLPDAIHTITLAPPPGSPVDVTAQLAPRTVEHVWHVRVHNRTRRIDYPLFEAGGANATVYNSAEQALHAAIEAVRSDLTDELAG